jgi:hypothetical protein
MPGPAPKPNRQRERDEKRRSAEFTTVVADNRARGPRLTDEEKAGYDPRTLTFYEVIRKSPQAQLYEDTDWLTIRYLLLPLQDKFLTDKRKPATTAAEIRQIMASLGATVADRLRTRIAIEHGSTTTARADSQVPGVIDLMEIMRGKQ